MAGPNETLPATVPWTLMPGLENSQPALGGDTWGLVGTVGCGLEPATLELCSVCSQCASDHLSTHSSPGCSSQTSNMLLPQDLGTCWFSACNAPPMCQAGYTSFLQVSGQGHLDETPPYHIVLPLLTCLSLGCLQHAACSV